MARCRRTTDLEVHHKNVDCGNGLDNAMVLCHQCHAHTHRAPNPKSPQPFTDGIKNEALRRAGYQCQCEKGICCA